MRGVEADHLEWSAVVEDGRGGLRVGPDVELGMWRAVAVQGAATHQRDTRDALPKIGGGAQGEGDVGERAKRCEPDPFTLVLAHEFDDGLNGARLLGGASHWW